MPALPQLRSDALAIFQAALAAADPRAAVLRVLARSDEQLLIHNVPFFDLTHGKVIVVGTGKAGAPMAQAVEEVLGERLSVGAVSVKYGHLAPTRTVQVHEAGHPLPDENGVRANRTLVSLLEHVTADDLVICLLSGGGSALME